MKTRKAHHLPLKSLDWEPLLKKLIQAHEVLARFDQVIKNVKNPRALFSALTYVESVESYAPHIKNLTIKNGFNSPRVLRNYQAINKLKNQTFSYQLLYDIYSQLRGKKIHSFRKSQNWIGPEGCTKEQAFFFPPNVTEMHRNMENLKRYFFYKEKDPLIQIAIFFAQLLIIHPFMDGNGRIARILIPYMLYKKRLVSAPLFYMSGYFKKHRNKYFLNLFNITQKKDWESWIVFFLDGVIKQGKLNVKRAESISKDHSMVAVKRLLTIKNLT